MFLILLGCRSSSMVSGINCLWNDNNFIRREDRERYCFYYKLSAFELRSRFRVLCNFVRAIMSLPPPPPRRLSYAFAWNNEVPNSKRKSCLFPALKGYTTVLYDDGSPLTSYQKHLLALARVMVRKPRILLWEEDLSIMDNSALNVLANYLDQVRDKDWREIKAYFTFC